MEVPNSGALRRNEDHTQIVAGLRDGRWNQVIPKRKTIEKGKVEDRSLEMPPLRSQTKEM